MNNIQLASTISAALLFSSSPAFSQEDGKKITIQLPPNFPSEILEYGYVDKNCFEKLVKQCQDTAPPQNRADCGDLVRPICFVNGTESKGILQFK